MSFQKMAKKNNSQDIIWNYIVLYLENIFSFTLKTIKIYKYA